jgi:hypothetical protein
MLLVLQFYVYVVCPFVLFILAIVFSLLLRYADFHYPFGICKLFSSLSLDCRYFIASAVFSNAYLDIYSDLDFQHYPLFSVFIELRSEVIIRFIDIDGFADHHCLNFLFLFVIETKRKAK